MGDTTQEITRDSFTLVKEVYHTEGRYEVPSGQAMSWPHFFDGAEEIEVISPLYGWGDWTHSLRVYRHGRWSRYFAK